MSCSNCLTYLEESQCKCCKFLETFPPQSRSATHSWCPSISWWLAKDWSFWNSIL